MSWFGLGGSKKKENNVTSTYGGDDPAFVDDSATYSSGPDMSASSGYGAGLASQGQANVAQLQEMWQAEQQKAQLQQVINHLTEVAFESCVDKSGKSLSGSEQKCIMNSVHKYLDTSDFVVGRMSHKGE